MSSSVGMMKFPIYGKRKFMFQTTNQVFFEHETKQRRWLSKWSNVELMFSPNIWRLWLHPEVEIHNRTVCAIHMDLREHLQVPGFPHETKDF